ncbi:hypothetical protein BD410DRAFT_356936 [Rickenella mellea]|uniref:Uncharacterized protein n=1 Tax=Rickenella mellea TaxID=50990 RepID=A0A4Y7Q1P9_9AGAM|nr:hypothetical protein BD410DRAFT_356936 [Rickenella mellea]
MLKLGFLSGCIFLCERNSVLPTDRHFELPPEMLCSRSFCLLSFEYGLARVLAALLVNHCPQYLRNRRSIPLHNRTSKTRHFLIENVQWWRMYAVVQMMSPLQVSLLFPVSISPWNRNRCHGGFLHTSLRHYLAYLPLASTPLVFPEYRSKVTSSCFLNTSTDLCCPTLSSIARARMELGHRSFHLYNPIWAFSPDHCGAFHRVSRGLDF